MSLTDEPAWSTPAGGIPDELVRLARRCFEADGGLPLATDPVFLRRRWAAPDGTTFALRAADGTLLAAAAVCPAPDGPIVTGLVDPSSRGRGLGARLLDRALATAAHVPAPAAANAAVSAPGSALGSSAGSALGSSAASVAGSASGSAAGAAPASAAGAAPDPAAGPAVGATAGSAAASASAAGHHAGVAGSPSGSVSARGSSPAVITVETESLTAEADRLFTARGFRQVFAEDVMWIDPSEAAPPVWPPGTLLSEWSPESAGRFHAAYRASFRDRPGFPDEPADEWIAEYADDDEFRPAWSVVADVPGLGDAGFVAAAAGWIVQIGVVPPARGRGIGAALMRESLSRMAADGAAAAWLNVNVNNPGAAALYRRLGFTRRGRRARYRR